MEHVLNTIGLGCLARIEAEKLASNQLNTNQKVTGPKLSSIFVTVVLYILKRECEIPAS